MRMCALVTFVFIAQQQRLLPTPMLMTIAVHRQRLLWLLVLLLLLMHDECDDDDNDDDDAKAMHSSPNCRRGSAARGFEDDF